MILMSALSFSSVLSAAPLGGHGIVVTVTTVKGPWAKIQSGTVPPETRAEGAPFEGAILSQDSGV